MRQEPPRQIEDERHGDDDDCENNPELKDRTALADDDEDAAARNLTGVFADVDGIAGGEKDRITVVRGVSPDAEVDDDDDDRPANDLRRQQDRRKGDELLRSTCRR